MKIKHLLEGAEPKLPGAVSGIQIMTPQQFVAKSAEGEEPGPEQGVAEGSLEEVSLDLAKRARDKAEHIVDMDYDDMRDRPYGYSEKQRSKFQRYIDRKEPRAKGDRDWDPPEQGVAEDISRRGFLKGLAGAVGGLGVVGVANQMGKSQNLDSENVTTVDGEKYTLGRPSLGAKLDGKTSAGKYKLVKDDKGNMVYIWNDVRTTGGPTRFVKKFIPVDQVNEQGVAEATKLPASTRELKGQELEDYLDRIRNREKTKQDKYKMPYIHRSSVMGYYNEEGKKYNTDAIKAALKERPKKLLKQNEKMKHSNGELEQFFNIGFAALTGIALDENTNELIIVNTCPGAGSCKVDCFAMKGGKIQFQGPWLSDGRILTYLLNDPDGFMKQLDSEIKKEEAKGDKGGYTVTIRWHDAGDFFSPEYVDLAFNLAKANPDVMFYAYTKMGDVVLAQKPANFMINWSEGAHTSQEKKVKAADTNLDQTKNSRIVPSNLFYDLLVKDEKKNLVKGPEGQWQVLPDKLPELKQRLAKEYGLSPSSILSYNEWETKGKRIPNMKWNVIITPGEPDITARDPGVLSTLLLKH